MADLFPRASADFIRRNPALFGGGARRPSGRPAQPPAPVQPALVRGKSGPAMNKTEERCLEMLRRRFPGAAILPQRIRFFPLKGGGTYTPDFLVVGDALPMLVVEVKGGYRGAGAEQGYDRYKRAALEWSDGRRFRFVLCTWERMRREWRVEPWE